jgi:alkanesulfonate monooxygenase SsuD/methylene tetrahydromethanopterin reductase-like flavin-dependent oxidoreductase (luciferase family)
MDFGLFFLMQRDEAWSEQRVYDSALEQMLAAEPMGYHSVWIAEHHFNDYGLCPTPPVLASFLAARTRTLRLGMGVSLLPLHHPVDLAEQLAVLDVVSEGRSTSASAGAAPCRTTRPFSPIGRPAGRAWRKASR